MRSGVRMSSPLVACRYVEAMRKRKLQGGKQDIAGAKEDNDSRTKDWKVELTAASRALALRWLRAAREGLDGEHSCGSDVGYTVAIIHTCLVVLRPGGGKLPGIVLIY